MANAPRYRYGASNPRKLPIKATFGFNIGDLMYLDSSDTVTPPDQSSTLFPIKPAGSLSWVSAIADPVSGPTVTAVSATGVGPGFTVASTGFKVAFTYVTADGAESGPSGLSSAMNTNGDAIEVTGVTVPAGVVAVNWYVTSDGGAAGTLQLVDSSPYGNGVTIGGPPPSDAPAPPAASNLTATLLTQISFAKKFVGASSQFYDGNSLSTTAYGVKDGYARIGSGGVWDYACASATFNEGDKVGVAKATGNALDPQTLVAVSYKAAAVGVVVQGGVGITAVRVELYPAKSKLSYVNF